MHILKGLESYNSCQYPVLILMMYFPVDGSRAGSGNLEILVNGGRVTSAVRALGGQRFLASFTPHRTATHTIQITFNDETVPGKCTKLNLLDFIDYSLYSD